MNIKSKAKNIKKLNIWNLGEKHITFNIHMVFELAQFRLPYRTSLDMQGVLAILVKLSPVDQHDPDFWLLEYINCE